MNMGTYYLKHSVTFRLPVSGISLTTTYPWTVSSSRYLDRPFVVPGHGAGIQDSEWVLQQL